MIPPTVNVVSLLTSIKAIGERSMGIGNLLRKMREYPAVSNPSSVAQSEAAVHRDYRAGHVRRGLAE